MCYNGFWGSICDDGVTSKTAAVACRLLGHQDITEGQELVLIGQLINIIIAFQVIIYPDWACIIILFPDYPF